MKYYCTHCQKSYTEDDLAGLLPICECGDDLLQEQINLPLDMENYYGN